MCHINTNYKYVNPLTTYEPIFILDVELNEIERLQAVSGRVHIEFDSECYTLGFNFSYTLEESDFEVISGAELNPKFREYRLSIYNLLHSVLKYRLETLLSGEILPVYKPQIIVREVENGKKES